MALQSRGFALSSGEAGHTLTKAPVSIKMREFVLSSWMKNPGCGWMAKTSVEVTVGVFDVAKSRLSLRDACPATAVKRGRRPRFLEREFAADARDSQVRTYEQRDRTCGGIRRGQTA